MKLKIILLLTLCMWCLPAFGDQITLGGDGTILFCGGGGTNITVSGTGATCPPSGGTATSGNSGSFESPTGNTIITLQPWSITFATGLQFGSPSGAVFVPVAQPLASKFVFGTGGQVKGDMTFLKLVDGVVAATAYGHVKITSNTAGNAALAAAFPVNSVVNFDFTVGNLSKSLVTLFTGLSASTASGKFSSGEVVGVPEVSSIFLMGTATLGMGTLLRYRRRKS